MSSSGPPSFGHSLGKSKDSMSEKERRKARSTNREIASKQGEVGERTGRC